LGVPPTVETVSVEVPCPPAVNVTLAVLRETVGPLLTIGDIVADRVTLPDQLLMLDTVIIDCLEEPLEIDRLDGLADRPKSWTVNVAVTEWVSPKLAVPVTVTV
jgi:hypothetical protein